MSPHITAAFASEELYNVQAFGLSKALARERVSVRIFTIKKSGDPSERLLESCGGKVGVEYLRMVPTPISRPLMSPRIVEELRGGSYDVVQISEDTTPTSVLLGLFRGRVDARYAVYQGVYRTSGNSLARIYSHAVDTAFLRMMNHAVDAVVAKTRAAQEYMISRGYRNVTVVPVGVDTDHFKPLVKHECRSKLGLRDDDEVLLYVGKITAPRDLGTCIMALSRLRRSHSRMKLLVVGEGPYMSDILSLANSFNVSDRLRFLGSVKNKDMPAVYGSADVTLLPMRSDAVFTYGMVIPESLACGTPVVSVPVPAAVDHIVPDLNGAIVPFEDAGALADVLGRFFTSEGLLERMSSDSRLYCCRELDWSIIARRLLSIYRQFN